MKQETKDKIRSSMLAYWEEVRLLERAGFGEGRHHTEEAKEKMRKAAKGRKLSPQAKVALAKYQQERKENALLRNRLKKEK